jgi:hypothetical protein
MIGIWLKGSVNQGDDLQEAPTGEHDSEQHGGGGVDARSMVWWCLVFSDRGLEIEVAVRIQPRLVG